MVMKQILGFSTFDVTKIGGFYAFLFPYLEITVAIHAVLLGNGIIVKEERDKTTEFLITKPVSRYTIITSKLFAAFVNIAVINIVTLLSSLAIIPSFGKEDITGEILALMLSMFFVQLIFLFLGTFLAAVFRKPKASGSVAVSILLGAYIISKITDVTDQLNAINIFSPFKYFSLTDMVNGSGLNFVIVILSVLLSAVFAFSTYYFYVRRDLNV
jgi:ABC-2 type transport system permease protein